MLTRRSFVQAAAAVSLAPWIWTPLARAQAPSERLNVGFIGVGTMGRGHLGNLLGRDNVEVVAVWVLFAGVATAIFVTYSRISAHELYHVSGSGLTGGASRALVFVNFPLALVAIAIL
ncbi:MAG: hypothetical protein WEH44_06605, partial [Pirellulaceae bacterium]